MECRCCRRQLSDDDAWCCSGCRSIIYCSVACQHLDWRRHAAVDLCNYKRKGEDAGGGDEKRQRQASGIMPVDDDHAAKVDWLQDSLLADNNVTIADIKRLLMTIGDGLELRPSIIPNAGLGLFLTRQVTRGTVITWYDGARIDMASYLFLRAQGLISASHAFEMMPWMMLGNYIRVAGGLRRVVDAQTTMQGRGGAAFVNTLYGNGGGFNIQLVPIYGAIIGWPRPTEKNALIAWFERSRPHPNDQIIVAVALRDMSAGEELYADYACPQEEDKSNVSKERDFLPIQGH